MTRKESDDELFGRLGFVRDCVYKFMAANDERAVTHQQKNYARAVRWTLLTGPENLFDHLMSQRVDTMDQVTPAMIQAYLAAMGLRIAQLTEQITVVLDLLTYCVGQEWIPMEFAMAIRDLIDEMSEKKEASGKE